HRTHPGQEPLPPPTVPGTLAAPAPRPPRPLRAGPGAEEAPESQTVCPRGLPPDRTAPRRHCGAGAAAPRAPAPRGRASRTRPRGAPPPQPAGTSPGPPAAPADEPGSPPATSPAEQRRHIRRHQPDDGQQHRCQPPPPVRGPLLLTSGDPLLGRVDLGFQLGALIGDLLVLDLVHL